MLTPEIESQIADLSARYGQPRRSFVELTGGPFDPLTMTDRVGEVCMVVRRPNGKLLTAIKTFYPPGAYRLLTGGVGHAEPIEAALLREVDEETGLEVVVRRFLAVIEYELQGGWGLGVGEQDLAPASSPQPLTPNPYTFVTFAFLLDEVGGMLGPRDADERIDSFREVDVAELPALAESLERVGERFDPQIDGLWGDWGRFRAVVHRVVYEALTE